MGAGVGARDVLMLSGEIRDGGDNDSEEVQTESDSEGEIIQSRRGSVAVELRRELQRVDVPGFSKRTYGGDFAADASLERRHKSAKLDAQLEDLRAILPDVVATSRSEENTNVVLDTYHYIATLQRKVEDLNADLLDLGGLDSADAAESEQCCESSQTWSSLSCHSGLRRQPMVDVAKRDGLLQVRIVCVNRPGLLVDVMEAVESRGLSIAQAKIACHNEIVVEYLILENEDFGENLVTKGEKKAEYCVIDEEQARRVKAILMHAICCTGTVGESDVNFL